MFLNLHINTMQHAARFLVFVFLIAFSTEALIFPVQGVGDLSHSAKYSTSKEPKASLQLLFEAEQESEEEFQNGKEDIRFADAIIHHGFHFADQQEASAGRWFVALLEQHLPRAAIFKLLRALLI